MLAAPIRHPYRFGNRSVAHRRPVHRLRGYSRDNQRPNCRTPQVFAVELSEDAIPYTRKNLEPLGVHLDQGTPSPPCPNLPEPSTRCSRTLRTFRRRTCRRPGSRPARPDMALYGGERTASDALRDCRPRLRASYTPGGLFIMEHDDTQEDAVAEAVGAVASRLLPGA